VSQTENATPDSPPHSGAARLLWAALILATLYLCYFHNLGALGLVGPDEPRYAWIARDMAETGDWVTPRLYGQPWFEKPPLYYWGAALSFKLFGVSETTARLPSAVCALLATLALAWLALRIYGAETARWLLVLLPTTVGMIGFSHAAATDMPFAAMLTIGMVFAARLLGQIPQMSEAQPSAQRSFRSLTSFTSSTSFTSLLFGFFLGLATLAKGPAAIVLSGCTVLLWAGFTKRWRDAFRCLHPIAILGFCVTALPWYIVCAQRNPDFFRVFIIEHNFKRFLTPEFQHIKPVWFYIPILLIAVFPWTLFFFTDARSRTVRIWNERVSRISHTTLLLCCWPLFCLFFFSLSRSKLPGYILPAVLPLALLLANTVRGSLQSNARSLRWPIFGTALALIIFGVTLQREAPKIPALNCVSPVCGVTRIWVIAVCGGFAVGILTAIRKLRFGLSAAILCVLLLVIEVDRFLPNLDPGVSARDAVRVADNVWPEFTARNAATWQLSRSYAFQLSYYTHQEIPDWKPDEPKPNWLFVPKGKQGEAENLGFHCVKFAVYPAVIPCRAIASLDGLGGGLGRRGSGSAGSSRGGLNNGQPR
jgi:4-amino-4-deoxy-L-arabinose transferase-like glycosyltransferase